MTDIAFDTAGNVKHASAEELALADKDTVILGYIQGAMEDGRPYYAYVAIKPSKYREFHALTAAKKAMVIGDYGTVVAAGFESEPPLEIVRRMRETYGFDDQYERKLKEETLKQRELFFEKQEKTRIEDIVTMLKTKQPSGS